MTDIPVLDITTEEPTAAEIQQQGREGAERILERGDAFLMLSLPADTDQQARIIEVVATCSDEDLLALVATATSILGAAKLGAGAIDAMPAPVYHATCMTVGYKALGDGLKALAEAQIAAAENGVH